MQDIKFISNVLTLSKIVLNSSKYKALGRAPLTSSRARQSLLPILCIILVNSLVPHNFNDQFYLDIGNLAKSSWSLRESQIIIYLLSCGRVKLSSLRKSHPLLEPAASGNHHAPDQCTSPWMEINEPILVQDGSTAGLEHMDHSITAISSFNNPAGQLNHNALHSLQLGTLTAQRSLSSLVSARSF